MRYHKDTDGDIIRHSDKGTSWWTSWAEVPQWAPWESWSNDSFTTDGLRVYVEVPDTLCLLKGFDEIL